MTEHQSQPVSTSSESEVNLVDYLIVLFKNSRFIIYTTIGIALLTFLILLIIPKKYTATAIIIPPQQNMTLSGQLLDSLGGSIYSGPSSLGGVGGLAASILGLKTTTDHYVGILSSETIFDRIIDRFHLRKQYRKKYIEQVREKLEKRVSIKGGKEGLIYISVTDETPQQAADMANAFVEELSKLLNEIGEREAAKRLAFLESELEQASVSLAKAEEELRAFSEKTSLLLLDTQARGIIEYIAGLRAAIDFKEVELQILRKQATPSNYDVIRLETEVNALKEKLHKAEYQESKNPRKGDVMISTTQMPALGLEYMRLYRQAIYREGIYRLHCKLVELARIDKSREMAILHVVDQATKPERKSSPRRLLITLLVTCATFFLLIFSAFAREFWQNTKQDEGNSERLHRLDHYLHKWDREMAWFLFLSRKIKATFKK